MGLRNAAVSALGWAARLPSVADAEAGRLRARFAARAGAELAQDRGDVVVDGALRDDEPLGDLGVPHAPGHEREHVELAGGQAGGVVARRRPRAAGHAAHAALSQPAPDGRDRSMRAELAE